MEILKRLALQAPNVWGASPILEVWVAASPSGQRRSEELPAIAERLVDLAQPHLAAGEFQLTAPGGSGADFVLASWLEQLTRKLQSLSLVELPAGRVIQSPDGQICRIAIHFEDEGVVRPALDLAYGLLKAATAGTTYDFATELRELQSLANELSLGPSTRAIVLAARARGIPVRRLNEASFVQFGQGAQLRRICTAETDGTGAIAESIAQDKELTKSLLRGAGIPVPLGRAAESAEDAWEAACEVGLPVVVKPRDGNHGRGVAIQLSTRERIMTAYEVAEREGSGVLIEQYVPGTVHRVLVVNHQAVAVSRGQPEVVVGDGVHTIEQLVEIVNLDPRRGDEYALPFCRLRIDKIALSLLEHQGYDPSTVPEPDVTIMIRRNGEYTTDVTDHLHPEVAARAVLAARVVGLDVAGIDLVASDISRPLEEQGAMVIEVNAGPGLQMHSEPQVGQPRPVGAAIVETLFPDGQTGRIPLLAVAEGVGSSTAAQVTAQLMRESGLVVGLTCSTGTFVGQRRLAGHFQSIGPGPTDLLLNPLIEAGVFEISAAAFYSEGLAFDSCRAAIVMPALVPQDSPQQHAVSGMHEPDAWRRIIAGSVAPLGTAVLSADDPAARQLASACRGTVLYCHAAQSHPLLSAHRSGGGKVVFQRGGAIWAAAGEQEFELGPAGGAGSSQILAVLAGAAAVWSAGVPLEVLRRGLESLGPLLQSLSTATNVSGAGGAAACSDQPNAA